jgi:hypothetical protein
MALVLTMGHGPTRLASLPTQPHTMVLPDRCSGLSLIISCMPYIRIVSIDHSRVIMVPAHGGPLGVFVDVVSRPGGVALAGVLLVFVLKRRVPGPNLKTQSHAAGISVCSSPCIVCCVLIAVVCCQTSSTIAT